MNNRQLYPRLLREFARTSRLDTGRACLLTHDHKCMLQVRSASFLHLLNDWWEECITRENFPVRELFYTFFSFVFSGMPRYGSVTMSTIRRQSMWLLAFLQAKWILMLTYSTSVSISLSQLVFEGPQ